MIHAMRNCVTEWTHTSAGEYKDPFNEIKLHALVTDPDGEELRVPAFWAGGTDWRIRFSSPKTGIHRFRTDCSDSSNDSLHGLEGEIRVTEYTGENPLFLHGPLRKSVDSTYLEHSDGTPFYWLADTWWMGLTKRLRWPEGFQTLLQDRVQKGFSVVQIVAGLYPDMHPFDERGANEAGFPWDEKFTSVNPSYFDMADRRLACLVDAGIVPCIVGCWGFFIDFAGREAVKKHWDYLVARYAAYPVVFCLAGEALMPFYLSEFRDPEKRPAHDIEMRKGWTEITRHVKQTDPFHRPITIHATKFGHEMLDDPALLDLNMLQTGHGGFHSLAPTAEMIETAVTRKPRLPDPAASFAGMISGKVVTTYDSGEFVLGVAKVVKQWRNSKAADANSLVGKTVLVAPRKDGDESIAKFIRSLKLGEVITIDVAHRGKGEALTIIELTEPQRKRVK